jgi:hypothetical protein
VSRWEDEEQRVADGQSVRDVLRQLGNDSTRCPACHTPRSPESGRCVSPPCDYYRVPASAVQILEAERGGAHHRDSQAQAAYQRYRDHLQAEARRHDRGARVTSGKEALDWLAEVEILHVEGR